MRRDVDAARGPTTRKERTSAFLWLRTLTQTTHIGEFLLLSYFVVLWRFLTRS